MWIGLVYSEVIGWISCGGVIVFRNFYIVILQYNYLQVKKLFYDGF